MAGGFGGSGWGSGPWGGFGGQADHSVDLAESISVTEEVTLDLIYAVLSASSVLPFLVRIDFSGNLDAGHSPNFDANNYAIPGLDVFAVYLHPTSSNAVLVLTSEQQPISYTVTVDPSIRSASGDFLNPAFNTAIFLGSVASPRFEAVAQSSTKVRLTFSEVMAFDANFSNPSNYIVAGVDGTLIGVASVSPILDGSGIRGELILSDGLEALGYYTVTISSAVQTEGGSSLSPNISMFQWRDHVPRPIFVPFRHFSGEVSGGLLGSPDGQVFFSPAYNEAVADSIIQVDDVQVCTRAYDVYKIPDIPDPPVLFTFPAPPTVAASHLIGSGAVIFGTADRLGLAWVSVNDFRQDTFPTPEDGPCEATLVETIDITSGGFTNDLRWETFPATTASLGAFMTADNLSAIGPGPTTVIPLQP